MKKNQAILLIGAAIVFSVIARLTNHLPNFAPLTALALVSGFYGKQGRSWLIPLAALLLSDLILGFYTPGVMLAVYASYAIAWGVGRLASRDDRRIWLVPATLAASLAFFLISNAAVWAFTGLYPQTLAGLGASYIAAIPFFRNSLLSDVFFTAVFATVAEVALARQAQPTSLVEPS